MHDTCAAVHGLVEWQPVPTAVVPTATDGSVGAMNDTITGDI